MRQHLPAAPSVSRALSVSAFLGLKLAAWASDDHARDGAATWSLVPDDCGYGLKTPLRIRSAAGWAAAPSRVKRTGRSLNNRRTRKMKEK